MVVLSPSSYAAAGLFTLAFEQPDPRRRRLADLERQRHAVSTAPRRQSSPAPILDEFPLGRLLKTFDVKGRKP